MSDVILLGDSIRIGYQEKVRKQIARRATVWTPDEHSGTTERTIEHLDEWVISRRPDVVHLNCGLHDIRTEFGCDVAAVPLNRYADNVRSIMTRLEAETDATVIWALTTPVNQEWHHNVKGFDRLEEDVVAYNTDAAEICRELGVAVNDLYSLVNTAGRDDLLLPDGVHFKPEGYALLGGAVAECIKKVLTNPR